MTDDAFTTAAERLLTGLPVGTADQLRAARHEADQLLADLSPPRLPVDRATLERLAAVVAQCSACEHIGDSPAPAVVLLPARMTLCLTCASVAVALPQPPGCHWCGDSEPAGDVVPHAVQFGPLTVCGDACGSCAESFGAKPESR